MSMQDRPEALDGLLGAITEALPDEATVTAEARAAEQAAPGIDRIPMSRSVRYTVRGMADVPDEYNETRTIRPREITLTYRDGQDPQLGGVHAYVKGWWMEDGARVHAESVGRHLYGPLAAWPEELAAEARLHDLGPS